MATLTAPFTTLGLLQGGVDLVDRLDPPAGTSVHVDHHVHRGDHSLKVWLFTDTPVERRLAMCSPVFAGAAWEVFPTGTSLTTVDGIGVYLATPRTVPA